MSENKQINLIFAFIGIGIFSCLVFAYLYSYKYKPVKVVKDFWQFSLDNKMEEAKNLTTVQFEMRSARPTGTYGATGKTYHLDGTETDSVYRRDIYERQIKIDRITETGKSGYRAGVRLETTDMEGRKSEYIACLGQLETDDSWKIFYVTLSNVDSKQEKIEDKCFEKIGR